MTQERIPIVFEIISRSPNHSFNLAPSIPHSGGVEGPHQINEVLGLSPRSLDLNLKPKS